MDVFYRIYVKPQGSMIIPALDFGKRIKCVSFDPDERILYLQDDGWNTPNIAAIPIENVLYWERVEESE